MTKTQRQQPTQGWMMGAVAVLALMLATATLLPLSARAGTGNKALPPEKVPAFAVPRMSQPPKTDGAIDATEWRETTAVSGGGNWANPRVINESESD